MNKLIYFILCFLITACSSAPPEKPNPMPFSKHDKVLYNIGECSRSRRNIVARECLEKYRNHVFKGKLLVINPAKIGVEALVDIGQTEVTCHIYPSDQTWQMLKSLVVGDIVAVNGWPEDFHNSFSYNNLILSDCTLLPIQRYSEVKKEQAQSKKKRP